MDIEKVTILLDDEHTKVRKDAKRALTQIRIREAMADTLHRMSQEQMLLLNDFMKSFV